MWTAEETTRLLGSPLAGPPGSSGPAPDRPHVGYGTTDESELGELTDGGAWTDAEVLSIVRNQAAKAEWFPEHAGQATSLKLSFDAAPGPADPGAPKAIRTPWLALTAVSLLGFSTEFAWAVGEATLMPHMIKTLDVSVAVASLVWLTSPIVSVFLQPTLGRVMDAQTNHGFGRRRPFVVAIGLSAICGIFLLLGGEALALRLGLPTLAVVAVIIFAFGLADLSHDCLLIPGRALIGDMAEAHGSEALYQAGHAMFSGFQDSGRLTAELAGMFPLLGLGLYDSHDTYRTLFTLAAGFILLCCTIACFGSRLQLEKAQQLHDADTSSHTWAVRIVAATLGGLPLGAAVGWLSRRHSRGSGRRPQHWSMAAGFFTAQKDHYETLGLTKEASAADIKRAYRKLALKYHPDVNPGAAAQQLFRLATEAYKVLSDPEQRQQYDATRAEEAARPKVPPRKPPPGPWPKDDPANPFPSPKKVERRMRELRFQEEEVDDNWGDLFADLLEELRGKPAGEEEQEAIKQAIKSGQTPGKVFEHFVEFLEKQQKGGPERTDWYEEFIESLKNMKPEGPPPRPPRTRPPPMNLWAKGKVPLSAVLSNQDFYQVLGVPRGATMQQVKDAYRRKIKPLENVLTESLEAQRQYHIYEEAFKILGSPSARQLYDMDAFKSIPSNKKPAPKPAPATFAQRPGSIADAVIDQQLLELKERMRQQGRL